MLLHPVTTLTCKGRRQTSCSLFLAITQLQILRLRRFRFAMPGLCSKRPYSHGAPQASHPPSVHGWAAALAAAFAAAWRSTTACCKSSSDNKFNAPLTFFNFFCAAFNDFAASFFLAKASCFTAFKRAILVESEIPASSGDGRAWQANQGSYIIPFPLPHSS